MKKSFSKITSVLLVLIMMASVMSISSFNASATTYSGTCGDNLNWTLNAVSGELKISGFGKMMSFNQYQAPWYDYREIITTITMDDRITNIGSFAFTNCNKVNRIMIPSKVRSIGSWAFKGCTSLKDVSFLGNEVTLIADYAFSECYSLHFFTIPESVNTLYEDAFYGSGLKYIHIPKNLIRIDARAFAACVNLLEITVDKDNPSFSNDIHGILYNKDKTILIQYPCNKEYEYFEIPEGVKIIDGCAFHRSQNLKTIILSDSVTKIYGFAFWELPQLKRVVLSNAILDIPYMCFADCVRLKEILIFSGVEKIDFHAFGNCVDLQKVYFSGSKSEWIDIQVETNNDCLLNATIHLNYDELSHYVAEVTPPTCTEQGYTTYTCECGDGYIDDYVDATGHSHTAEVTTPATHTTTGVMTYTCACGDTYTETIGKIAEHSHDAVVTAPTCTEQGYTTYTCECGDSYVDDYVPEKGHDEGIWSVTKPSTPTESGVMHLFCGECGFVLETKVIPATGKVSSVAISDISLDYKASTTITPSITVDSGVKYTVTYSSSDPSVASVDENGKVTSNGTGSATITVTVTDEFGNTVSDTCEVKVNYNWWQWILVIVLFGWIWY